MSVGGHTKTRDDYQYRTCVQSRLRVQVQYEKGVKKEDFGTKDEDLYIRGKTLFTIPLEWCLCEGRDYHD